MQIGNDYYNGSYAFSDHWFFNASLDAIENNVFFKPVIWVFEEPNITRIPTTSIPTTTAIPLTTIAYTQTGSSQIYIIISIIVVVILIAIVIYLLKK